MLPDIIGIIATKVKAVAVQFPEDVTVTVYVAAIKFAAEAIDGFC
jgi:hypothetical protein